MPEGTDSIKIARLEEMLGELLEITKENNKILHAARRADRITFWLRIIIWTIVIVLPFFLIGPLLRYLYPITGGILPLGSGAFGVPSSTQLQKAIEEYKAQYQANQAAKPATNTNK
jgi:hypothetical protein